jgi:hypothetical protein
VIKDVIGGEDGWGLEADVIFDDKFMSLVQELIADILIIYLLLMDFFINEFNCSNNFLLI